MVWILALDLGFKTGWAEGEAGQQPSRSGSRPLHLFEFLGWLNDRFKERRPRLVVVEDYLPLAAYKRLGTAEHSVYDALMRRGALEACCGLWGIELRAVDVLHARKHFTGRRSHGSREDNKRATIVRCRQLKYVAAGEADEDRCDALQIWDWASSALARKAPRELVLFGGTSNG
jgi:hypothetical protein